MSETVADFSLALSASFRPGLLSERVASRLDDFGSPSSDSGSLATVSSVPFAPAILSSHLVNAVVDKPQMIAVSVVDKPQMVAVSSSLHRPGSGVSDLLAADVEDLSRWAAADVEDSSR